jgi:hypothetical protein
MNRNTPNKPHPTPDPEKPHAGEGPDWRDSALVRPGAHANPDHSSMSRDDPALDGPTYDSCVDDLDQVLSQSMQQPEPDPNLESSGAEQGGGTAPKSGRDAAARGKPPRTSEIFRAVVASGGTAATAGGSTGPPNAHDTSPEVALPGLDITVRPTESADSSPPADRNQDGTVPWGQIALLSYSSALTLGLIWMFWSGRIPWGAEASPAPPEKPAIESTRRSIEPDPSSPAPPLPSENIATIGKTLRLGDLEVTPVSIQAMPVELVRTIDPDKRRREDKCLILRLRLKNLSTDRTLTPLDPTLVRERDFLAFDPYIVGSNGQTIRLFPLAIDSEWSILGQRFRVLQPGDSAETLIAAEPGAADRLADEMTWRVRLRTGVYRTDMLGVRFTRADVRHPRTMPWDDEG